MLHYNYSTSLSHFLNYHQLEDQQVNDNESITNTGTTSTTNKTTSNVYCDDFLQHEDIRCRSNSSSTTSNNKSFTIAAILGLKNDKQSTLSSPTSSSSVSSDLGAVNLSVHPTGTDRATFLTTCNRLQLPVRHHNNSSTVGLTTTTATTTTPGGGHYTVGHGCPPRQTVRALKHLQSTVVHSNKKSCKGKRVRTIFTPEQLERLEAEFERQQYMVGPERLYLAHTLQLTEAQVKVWFQNRRIKWRKHHLELTHQRLAVLKQQQLLLDETHADVQDTNSSTSTDT